MNGHHVLDLHFEKHMKPPEVNLRLEAALREVVGPAWAMEDLRAVAQLVDAYGINRPGWAEACPEEADDGPHCGCGEVALCPHCDSEMMPEFCGECIRLKRSKADDATEARLKDE